jgi:anionic cell wall polymer biosynthesis LytR-Cps2A-Psr (LCP) family protein
MNGKTALMYARSRHSTSDFDRSLRQQQIIKAIMNKLASSNSLNPSKMKELYADYTKIVKTNVSLDEMIGAARYAYNLKHIYSF